MSLALAMKTPSVPAPSQRSGRRRPRVLTICQARTSNPAASKSSCDWPRTMRSCLRHLERQPPRGVGERAHVGRRRERALVERRRAEGVRLLEGAHVDVARRAQERRVRADVEVDLVGRRDDGLPASSRSLAAEHLVDERARFLEPTTPVFGDGRGRLDRRGPQLPVDLPLVKPPTEEPAHGLELEHARSRAVAGRSRSVSTRSGFDSTHATARSNASRCVAPRWARASETFAPCTATKSASATAISSTESVVACAMRSPPHDFAQTAAPPASMHAEPARDRGDLCPRRRRTPRPPRAARARPRRARATSSAGPGWARRWRRRGRGSRPPAPARCASRPRRPARDPHADEPQPPA